MARLAINQSIIRLRSLPSVSLTVLYLFLICTDGNPTALLRYTEAIRAEMSLHPPSVSHLLTVCFHVCRVGKFVDKSEAIDAFVDCLDFVYSFSHSLAHKHTVTLRHT